MSSEDLLPQTSGRQKKGRAVAALPRVYPRQPGQTRVWPPARLQSFSAGSCLISLDSLRHAYRELRHLSRVHARWYLDHP